MGLPFQQLQKRQRIKKDKLKIESLYPKWTVYVNKGEFWKWQTIKSRKNLSESEERVLITMWKSA